MQFVISGAYYYNFKIDTILIPHFTGEYTVVDCTRYVKMEELKDRYNESYINEVKNHYIILDGEKYYNAEYSPMVITDDWDLLSDLSKLCHNEEENEF